MNFGFDTLNFFHRLLESSIFIYYPQKPIGICNTIQEKIPLFLFVYSIRIPTLQYKNSFNFHGIGTLRELGLVSQKNISYGRVLPVEILGLSDFHQTAKKESYTQCEITCMMYSWMYVTVEACDDDS